MGRFTKLAKLAVFLLVLYLLLELWSSVGKQDRSPEVKLLANRVWVDRVPKGPRDLVTHLALIKGPGVRKGALGTVSRFRFHLDALTFDLNGDRLDLRLPQIEKKISMKVKAYECKGPSGFDLCLDLTHGGRTLTLYSKKEWRPGSEARPDEILDVYTWAETQLFEDDGADLDDGDLSLIAPD